MTKKAKETKKKSNKVGRPTKYNEKLADKICSVVATSTVGLPTICKQHDDFPDEHTVYTWRIKHDEFRRKYDEAKLKQAEILAEECIQIADDGTNDYIENLDDEAKASYKYNGEHVQRSKLRVETRKWLAAKLLPRQFGDAVERDRLEGENENLKRELKELQDMLYKKHKKEY